jgi:hypothetical protein
MECKELPYQMWQTDVRSNSEVEYAPYREEGRTIDVNVDGEADPGKKTSVSSRDVLNRDIRHPYTFCEGQGKTLLDTSGEVLALAWMLERLMKSPEEFRQNTQLGGQPGDTADSVDLEGAIRLLRQEVMR